MTAKHEQRPNQDVTPSRAPFFPFYADDWIAGTLDLTFEERGFYIAVLAAMWSRKGPIPADHMSLALRCDKRQAARLLSRLIDLGKLSLDAANRVYNTKLNRLLDVTSNRAASARLRGEVREKSAGSPGEVQEKSGNIFPDKATKSTQVPSEEKHPFHNHIEREEESPIGLSSSAVPSDVPVLEAFQAWNALALRCGLPQASRLTPKRKTQIRARIREHGPDSWATALANIERSAFLRGIDRDWRANLDFLLQPSSFTKVFEGTYGNGAHAEPVVDPAQAAQSQALLEQALAELGEVH